MPTRDELASAIRDDLNDAGYFYDATDLNESLQDGYDEIAAFTGCIEKATSIALEADKTYYDLRTLIPDFIAIVAIYNRTTKRWLIPASDKQLDKFRENWELATGEPYAFWPVNYRYIAVFPRVTAVGTNLYVFYKAEAPTLVGATEPQIPVEICTSIMTGYSTMDMFEQAEEWVKAGIYFKQYVENIDNLIRMMKRRDSERPNRMGGSI